jgi:hypothetical protein
MKRGGCVVWGVGIVALLLGVGWLMYRPNAYRYKITVEVDTPSGPKTGFAVREIKYIPTLPVVANKFNTEQRGEAVAVDLSAGQTLFVLMDIDGHETIRAAVGQGVETDAKKLLDQANSDRRIYVYPPRERLRARNLEFPQLVRFRDISDPLSAERVAPDNLAAVFGPGVSMGRITLQMVDEPVTNEIPRRLPWRKNFPKGMLNGDRFEVFAKPEAAAHLSAFSFSTEPVK